MEASIRQLLERRRDRAISTILRSKERNCDKFLPMDASNALRLTVLAQLNEFHDMVFDLLESLVPEEDGVLLNDLWLERLEQIYSAVVG